MSDFDREAEREKLREQFGEEEEDREHSQRLSELLLKGATMTNRHCTECGDPIFRHDGREFCPSCQREVAATETQGATAGQAAAEDPLASTDEAAPEPSTDGDETPLAAESTDDGSDDAAPTDEPPVETPDATPDASPPVDTGGAPEQADTPGTGGATSPTPSTGTAGADAGSAAGLMPARQHLTRTVNRLAEQAAAEEDPGRKREFLAATREAAEALAAVRDAE